MQAQHITPEPIPLCEEAARKPSSEPARPALERRPGRRGATTMEYLVMLSFILLVVIIGVQTFGSSVAALFKVDVNATSQHPAP